MYTSLLGPGRLGFELSGRLTSATWFGISVSTDGHYYASTDISSGTASAASGRWNGDVTERSSGNKLQVPGEATCGSSAKT